MSLAGLDCDEDHSSRRPMPASLTTTDLADRLDALEARLPQIIEDHPDPGDFWMAFAGEADAIEDSAGRHARYVANRVRAMLSVHGRYIVDVDQDAA